MRISKVLVNIVLVIAFLVLCNVALTFVLEPYGSRSQLAWSDYAQQDDLDTVLVGTSHVEYGVDPAVLNEECGYDAYNLGTPSQTIEESLVSIRTAYEEHHVGRVILGLSTSAITSSTPPNPGSAYMRNRNRHVTPIEALATLNEFMWKFKSCTTAYSLNFPFPWASNPVRSLSFEDLASNVEAKVAGADVAEMAEKLEDGWQYVGLGHGARGDSINMNSAKVRSVNEGVDEDQEAGAAVVESTASIDPDRANTLREICAYCADRDIELVVIVPPLPVYDVFDENSLYFETMENATAFFSDLGVSVYDFNLASPDLFKSQPEYFSDNFHLNLQGAQVFSHALAQFLNKLDAGEEVGGLFNTPEQQALTIDYLSALFASTETDEQGIHLSWRTVTSPQADVEYQVYVRRTGEEDSFHRVTGWIRETSFTYPPGQRGAIELRINARHVGSSEKFERYRTVKTLW